MVLGDNEWNNLDNPDEGLEFWNRQFRDFEKHFPNTDQVKLNPPVLVTVTEDPNNPFTFDRRLDIGSRRELFIDDFLIDQHRGTSLQLQQPEPKDVVLVCDAP